jgi:DNA modification methylase
LVGIPWRVAFALQSDGWYLRQDIIWSKPNPMPESVTDRCTKSHEYIFLMAKSGKYYYDNEAIKETAIAGFRSVDFKPTSKHDKDSNGGTSATAASMSNRTMELVTDRNKRSVWAVATKPFKEAHFATFPPEIPQSCILAGTKAGDTVLDPFMGAGTTAVVAEHLNRQWIGSELNPEYIKIAEKRINAERAQMKLAF